MYAKELRQRIEGDKILIAPGAYDGLSARLVEQAGFLAIYASGGAIARSAGVPDIGLLSLTEVADRLRQITAVTSIPVIADADTGFGNELNVARTVALFEQAGVAGMHLEDQTFPKRCGHLDKKTVIPADEMCKKISAAKSAQTDADFVVIARTDAIAVEGFAEALDRARAYEAAGADMLFVEAPQTVEQIEQIAKHLSAPLLINMFYGGKTPQVPVEQLQEWGYRLVIIPSDLQRAAIFGMQQALVAIADKGDSGDFQESMASFAMREQIVGTKDYLK